MEEKSSSLKMMNILANHYNVFKAFNNKIYRKTLTNEHIAKEGAEKYIDKVFEVVKKEGEKGKYQVKENKPIMTKVIFMDKGGIKYMLPTMYQKHLPINVKESFECYLKKSDKTIYRFITEPSSVKITPEKTLSLKSLVEAFNGLPHSIPKVWQFLKLQAIGSKAKGGKYRLCSPPSTGKNCNDTILHSITNDNVKVSKPTIAKLETLFYYNQKVLPDEMTSLTTTQIREIEPFLLTIADESPTFTKHSMATKKDMNEVDITQASCIFTYNDIASLQEGSKFFDELWMSKKAFESRYPAFYLEGRVMTTLPKVSMPEANKILKENFEEMKMIAKNVVYYIQNMSSELHNWDRSKLMLKDRHRINTECIIDALDVFSTSQSEFDEWIEFVNKSVQDYKDKNTVQEVKMSEEVVGV